MSRGLYFDELCRRGIEASRIGREKMKERPVLSPTLKPIPDEIIKAHLPKPEGRSYMVSHKGGWDVYRGGTYVDTFDTKGAAWKALYED